MPSRQRRLLGWAWKKLDRLISVRQIYRTLFSGWGNEGLSAHILYNTMNIKNFTDKASGRLIHAPQGFLAFAPHPLPPAIDFDIGLALALSKADTALPELSGLGGQLPNPHLLISPYIKRKAVLSSRIEGTKASLSDLLINEIEDGHAKSPAGADDIKEVRNHIPALEHGIALLPELPLSLRLVARFTASSWMAYGATRPRLGNFAAHRIGSARLAAGDRWVTR